MTKLEFLAALREQLRDLPKRELNERLDFYGEMIDDLLEEAQSEEAAVASLGSPAAVAAAILGESGVLALSVQQEEAKGRQTVSEALLLVCGSPIRLLLLISVFALAISLWAVIVSLWASFGALIGSAFGGVVAAGIFVATGNGPASIAVLGAALACAGAGIFLFLGCKAITRGAVLLTRKMLSGVKKYVREKRCAQ